MYALQYSTKGKGRQNILNFINLFILTQELKPCPPPVS